MRSLDDSNFAASAKTSRMSALPALSAGCALPAKRICRPPMRLGEIVQTLAVAEEQGGALVRGDAAGEAERENVRVVVRRPVRCLHGRKEPLLAERVASHRSRRGSMP